MLLYMPEDPSPPRLELTRLEWGKPVLVDLENRSRCDVFVRRASLHYLDSLDQEIELRFNQTLPPTHGIGAIKPSSGTRLRLDASQGESAALPEKAQHLRLEVIWTPRSWKRTVASRLSSLLRIIKINFDFPSMRAESGFISFGKAEILEALALTGEE